MARKLTAAQKQKMFKYLVDRDGYLCFYCKKKFKSVRDPIIEHLNDDETDLKNTMRILHNHNVVPALSCGMHPGLVQANVRQFGNDFIANVGGAIHGHPMGTLGGARAMRQAIDKTNGLEYEQAIAKWGYIK